MEEERRMCSIISDNELTDKSSQYAISQGVSLVFLTARGWKRSGHPGDNDTKEQQLCKSCALSIFYPNHTEYFTTCYVHPITKEQNSYRVLSLTPFVTPGCPPRSQPGAVKSQTTTEFFYLTTSIPPRFYYLICRKLYTNP